MATTADGGPAILPSMPDFSSYNFSSAGDMKFHLQNLLDSKEKQLQQAGTLGQRVLAQQMELEERIRQLQEIDADKGEDEEIDTEARDRYRELADTIKAWDTENGQLSSAFGGAKRFVNGSQPSPSLSFSDLPREEPERSKASAGTSAAQSRRAKNAAHRADDVEFAFEIGSGLLTEVRRLQSLLGERDKAIQDMKEEKDDLEKSVESLRIALRQQEQSSDKFKEENWNLEVTLQELRTQLSDSQADAHRLEGEHKRLTKLLSASRDTGEQHKNESQRLKENIEELKAKHETDIAHARKHAAGLQRDKSDLQQAVDTMKVDVARAAKRLPFGGSPYTPNGPARSDFLTPADKDDDDVFSAGASTNRRKYDTSGLFPTDGFGSDFADLSPDPSPVRPILASNHPSNEIEALQQRLAHAQRQINTLKGTLQREKELRIDYRRKLATSPEPLADEAEEAEDDMDFEDVDAEPKSKRPSAFRSSGRPRSRGRGRGGMTLMQRMAAHSPSSEYNDDPVDPDTPPPPVPPIPIRFHGADEDLKLEELEVGDDTERRSPSPSPFEAPTNRTSVDGMDPAFANVLRRTPSYSGSPLRQSVMAKSARGGTIGRRRGGAAYQEARPPSLVGQPEALAAELGLGEPPIDEHQQIPVKEAVETVEFGCQTDFEEKPAPSAAAPLPLPIQVKPATTDMAVQVNLESVLLPVLDPPIVTCEISAQTDEEPVNARSDVAVQHDIPRPVLVSTGMNTEAELLPLASVKVQVETQTPRIDTFDVDTQTPVYLTRDQSKLVGRDDWRTTMTQHDLSRSSSTGNSSGDATITKAPTQAFLTGDFGEDDGEETETGVETDTDTDDYQDARQSVIMSTPSASVNDFHSVHTMTDNDFSESDDDGESIKVSRITSHPTGSSRPSSYHIPSPAVSYESKAISAEVVERLKPELKEMCIQTDEWAPLTPPSSAHSAAVPPPSPGFSLYRVGSSGQPFQFVAAPASAASPPSIPVSATLSSAAFRDSTATFGARSRTSQSERRQSMESVISSVMDEGTSRSRVPSGTLAPVDKTKPPMMALPPPPRLPPPTNMPPPSFIPERKVLPNIFYDAPPSRPSSPPPAELIQRATTPTFGSVLSIPGGKSSYGPRQHGSSMPPSQQGLRQLPSTSSFRSAANAASHAMNSIAPSGTLTSFSVRERDRMEFSSTSLASEHSMASPRSSMSSDHTPYLNRSQALPVPPVTPTKNANIPVEGAPGSSTDPAIIHAITQTMIGEFLYKYTRRAIGKGYGERRHKRFFWVHPYTKTLYWSSADPGSSNVSESSAKSAYIDGVRSVLDPNPMPPGLYQYSVVVSTPQREMKFTAPTKERHDIWLNALKYLLARPSAMNVASPGDTAVPHSPVSVMGDTTDDDHRQTLKSSPQSQRSGRSPKNGDSWNTTPRGQRSRSQLSVGGSIGKRSGTPAAEYLRWNLPESPYSPTKSFEHVLGQPDGDLDFELHGENLSDEGFEGLENVRACCDGRHTVGHHHRRHHPHDHLHNGDHNSENNPPEPVRPVSPAWSFRSRTGSANSHEGASGIFSWGRKDDGKLRFGSRRSTKTVPTHNQ